MYCCSFLRNRILERNEGEINTIVDGNEIKMIVLMKLREIRFCKKVSDVNEDTSGSDKEDDVQVDENEELLLVMEIRIKMIVLMKLLPYLMKPMMKMSGCYNIFIVKIVKE